MKTVEEEAIEYVKKMSERNTIAVSFGINSIIENAMKYAFIAGIELSQKWIPIEEEFPEEKTEVFVRLKNGKKINHDTDFFMNGRFHKHNNVTNWRPIELK